MQQRIEAAAEALGFPSVIGQQIAGSQDSVYLMFERGDQQIACEISVTTTIGHEVDNIRKCLKAHVPQVAVIRGNEDRLEKIAAAVCAVQNCTANHQLHGTQLADSML